MARRAHFRRLLVEGRVEQRLIPYLIESNGIVWGESREQAIVDIEEFDGVHNLLKAGVIEAELKASGLRHLGIVIDADSNFDARWNAVRDRCRQSFPDLPEQIPDSGLVHHNTSKLTLGIWIMPDNASVGMLETFLTYLLPNQGDPIYIHAEEASKRAKELGAPFSDHHVSKANIHTWLAWQYPPGRQLHEAIAEKILDPSSENARPFVNWFKRVFDL